MASPSNRRATKRRRSSITELAFHGIHTSRPQRRKVLPMCPVRNVTYVSGRSQSQWLCPSDKNARDRSLPNLRAGLCSPIFKYLRCDVKDPVRRPSAWFNPAPDRQTRNPIPIGSSRLSCPFQQVARPIWSLGLPDEYCQSSLGKPSTLKTCQGQGGRE